jgi:acyl transferase domain-containing protein/surfactin synthase thioesterase subunit/acyl carrier protein
MAPYPNSDIAIIGMACRFPGASNVQQYWQNLCDGIESVTFFSDEELTRAGVDQALAADKRYVKAAATLSGVEMFDAAFFGYSPREAAVMDPQHRLFLEVCWEAFEDAGYDPFSYPGEVGVISAAGGVVSTYLVAKLNHPEFFGQTAGTPHISNDKDFLSTRVSFKLNLTGPSFTIQSACSSSLLAVHQACQNLRFDQCEMMLVGGSAVRVPQVQGYLAEKRSVYSLDGHCRPFDAEAQGTLFSSGVGAVLLKRLDKALADRDHIFAVIKGTAANNDGSAKISYTAPSVGQQSKAAANALKLAGVSADSIGYVECHATGTTVGDPLEIEALAGAFQTEAKRTQYCALGSFKGNIGHPEQAAGIAGLIKTALILHHKRIPPTVNYQNPNPRIDFVSSPFYVNSTLQAFAAGATPRRAGLNSLGIGGTNVFAVLEEAPAPAARSYESKPSACLTTLSAKSPEALIARVAELRDWIEENPNADIEDVCYTTNVSRSQFGVRVAVPARSIAELKDALAAWLRNPSNGAASLKRTARTATAFMFSGQGSQHPGMAAELYRTHSVFRNAIDRCHALSEAHLQPGLRDVIFGSANNELLDRTEYAQPALFAVEYALTELLASWGITPDAVIGHSLGEITAACAAGVLTVEDAMQLVTGRGALMQRLPTGGGMAAVWAEESVVRRIIEQTAPEIAIAAVNGPQNTVVSGDEEVLQKLLTHLEQEQISYRKLRVANAFHSPRTEALAAELEAIAGQISHVAPKLPLISNVTGEMMTAAPDSHYWSRHLREPVRFGDGMLSLAKLKCETFIEIGPHPVLLPLAQMCLRATRKSAAYAATLTRGKPDADAIAELLVALYLAGHTINWTKVHAHSSANRIQLPTYPFQRQRHWVDDAVRPEPAQNNAAVHPLVGGPIYSNANEVRYEARYGLEHATYFSDHKIFGSVILPTSAELELAIAIGRMQFGTSQIRLDDAMHHQPISLGSNKDLPLQLIVSRLKTDRATFTLATASAETPGVLHTHLTGTLRRSEVPAPSNLPIARVRARCQTKVAVSELYDRLRTLGLDYGPGFRGILEVNLGEGEALTRVELPDGLADRQYLIHPAFLDACLHVYPVLLDGTAKSSGKAEVSYLPVSIQQFQCYQDGIDKAWVHTRLRSITPDKMQAVLDISIYDDTGRSVADIAGLMVRSLHRDAFQSPQAAKDKLFYRVAWRRKDRRPADAAPARGPASWIVFADAAGVGLALAKRLDTVGHHCHLVYRSAEFGHDATYKWSVNPSEPHHFRQLLDQFTAAESLRCEGVIYLWGLDAPDIEERSADELKSGSEMMCRGALAILHALAQTRSSTSSGRRLWFVTRNTQQHEGRAQPVDPLQAPLWGLGRTIAIEYPAIWGGLIDLPSSSGSEEVEAIATELLWPDGDSQIAISTAGRRDVARLVKHSLAELQPRSPQVRGDVTYLIAGGLGMLGRSVAKWLISKGAKHIVITSRRAKPQLVTDLFSREELGGARIHVRAADISRDQDVKYLIAKLGDELPPLAGVVHSAGVLDDGILAQLDWTRFAHLFEAKVYGSWLLHQHTKSLKLDFFILQSSLLSLLGSAGQANYSAANAFLDALAGHRRAAGLPATVVNWCAWSGGGLATLSGARGEAMWSSLGMKFISSELAINLFDELMHREVDQIAIASADWDTYARKVGLPLFLDELLNHKEPGIGVDFMRRRASPITAVDTDTAMPIRITREDVLPVSAEQQRMQAHATSCCSAPADQMNVSASASQYENGAEAASAVAGAGRDSILVALQRHLMTELGFSEPLDPNLPLNEVGLDSLRSVSLANRLEDEFGIPVAIAELISGPTANQIADHLVRSLPGPAATSQEKSPIAGLGQPRPDRVADLTAPSPSPAAAVSAKNGHNAVRFGSAEVDLPIAAQAPDWPAERSGDAAIRDASPNLRMTRNGSPAAGKWLIAPRPNPNAKTRLFCFPYAGGGVVSFRSWPQLLNNGVEVVAVEPPGRGTRINEQPIDKLEDFVARLSPELLQWLDRPSAFFGHCIGGLTTFATLCALPEEGSRHIKHLFACGVRPPHLLKRRRAFDDNLAYDMMLHQNFDSRRPPHAQPDDIFADIIRHFDMPAAHRMLATQKLRQALLPTIRAEFAMAYNYDHRPTEPFSFPITSFVGDADPWVSEQDSAAWGELTRASFTNHVRKGSHFLMADDGEYILSVIERQFVNTATTLDVSGRDGTLSSSQIAQAGISGT